MNFNDSILDKQDFIWGDKKHIWKLSLDNSVSILYFRNQKNENSFQIINH